MADFIMAWRTLVWFWITAHTLTLSLPVNWQIRLAAVWSPVLGIILEMAEGQTPAPSSPGTVT